MKITEKTIIIDLVLTLDADEVQNLVGYLCATLVRTEPEKEDRAYAEELFDQLRDYANYKLMEVTYNEQ